MFASTSSVPIELLRAMRPRQWTKNAIVLAAFFFALGDPNQAARIFPISGSIATIAWAVASFCMVSSGVYLLNDIRDRDADRVHPVKKNRPIAAGRLSLRVAWTSAILLFMAGLGSAIALSMVVKQPFAWVVGAYVLIQVIYSYGLKRVALLDVFVIAGGFVLRALGGAIALSVAISPWLLLCTLLLALFLGLCKRRHEKLFVESAGDHRESLTKYDARLLDQLIAVVSSATIVFYSIYTLSAETVAKFGTSALGLTIPFVLFGIFRYLDLVYRHDKGDQPERILLTDVPLLVDLVLYGAAVLAIFRFLR